MMNYLTYVSRSHPWRESCYSSGMIWGSLLWRQHSGERESAGLQDEFTMQELGITLPSDGLSENFRDSGVRREHADEVSWIIYDRTGQFMKEENANWKSVFRTGSSLIIWECFHILECMSLGALYFNCILDEWHIQKTKLWNDRTCYFI